MLSRKKEGKKFHYFRQEPNQHTPNKTLILDMERIILPNNLDWHNENIELPLKSVISKRKYLFQTSAERHIPVFFLLFGLSFYSESTFINHHKISDGYFHIAVSTWNFFGKFLFPSLSSISFSTIALSIKSTLCSCFFSCFLCELEISSILATNKWCLVY